MKKIFTYLFAIAFGIVAIIVVLKMNTINIGDIKNGKAVFVHEKSNTTNTIKKDDIIVISNLFENKKLYKDNPSCGFVENVAVQLDSAGTFCIAQDGCPIVYWQEKNRYFQLSETEQEELYGVLEKYGFQFPCI